ncbi:hypothetical protein PVK06_026591 [Gossypium arboreum]|uniref:RNase H type-1 domain-containing protein n=1 Tax=Gossypium arboreum TaxID=29729 RepID=A0ABR0NY60_GOSAR|nr:hypothetical protein PVK06_026591 [Gossypium arboreum]
MKLAFQLITKPDKLWVKIPQHKYMMLEVTDDFGAYSYLPPPMEDLGDDVYLLKNNDLGWVKINSDGATVENRNWSAVDGVLRDSHGNWLVGFCRFINRGFAITTELWAILHGLRIAWQKGYTKVIIESDNKSVVAMLTDVSIESSSLTTLVQRIKEECRGNWTVKIQHIFHKVNKVADYIVSYSMKKYDMEIIDFPMFDVRQLLLEDKMGDFYVTNIRS